MAATHLPKISEDFLGPKRCQSQLRKFVARTVDADLHFKTSISTLEVFRPVTSFLATPGCVLWI